MLLPVHAFYTRNGTTVYFVHPPLLLQIVRPPVIPTQNRSIAEDALGGAVIPSPFTASQPQSLAFNFSLTPSNVFGIQPTTGLVFLQVRNLVDFRPIFLNV